MLRAMGKRLIFVTNNSTKSRAGYLNKFLGLGLEITAEEVFSSSFAAAAYLDSIDFPKVGLYKYATAVELGLYSC